MLTKVNEYYGEGCDLEVLDKAMLLDPRFKNVSFVSSDILLPELTETARKLSIAARSSTHTPTTNTTTTTGPPLPKRQNDGNEGKLMKLLTDIIHAPDDLHVDPAEKAKVELQRYLTDVITDHFDPNGHLNPLQWWKLNAVRYPCVSILARKYLATYTSNFSACRKSI